MLTKNFIHNIVNFVSKLTKNFTYHIVNFFSKLDQISHFFAIKSKNWPFMQNFSFNLNLQIQSKFYPLNTNFYSNSTKISLVITHRFYPQIKSQTLLNHTRTIQLHKFGRTQTEAFLERRTQTCFEMTAEKINTNRSLSSRFNRLC